jgi:hypothetical protein
VGNKIKVIGVIFCVAVNVYVPTEDKSEGTKDSLYEQVEHIFDQFSVYDRNVDKISTQK